MIAIKLSVFRIGEEIFLHPVTVLDVVEEVSDYVDPIELVDRSYWEKKATSGFLPVIDKISTLLANEGLSPKVSYNRNHIALGTIGYNFCWFSPRKTINHCRVEIRVKGNIECRDATLASLINGGIDASAQQSEGISFGIRLDGFNERSALILEALKNAEKKSHSSGA